MVDVVVVAIVGRVVVVVARTIGVVVAGGPASEPPQLDTTTHAPSISVASRRTVGRDGCPTTRTCPLLSVVAATHLAHPLVGQR